MALRNLWQDGFREVGIYDSLNGWNINHEVLFPGETKDTPSDTLIDPVFQVCGFTATSISSSETGNIVSKSLAIGLIISSGILFVMSEQKWKKLPNPEKITLPQAIKLSDKIAIIALFVSSFQLCGLALTFDSVFSNVSASWVLFIKSTLAASLAYVFSASSTTLYWILFWISVSIGVLFFIFMCIILLRLDHKLPTFLINLMSVFGPLVGTIAFIPMTSIFLSVFSCMEESQGRAFLAKACDTWCWEGSHTFIVFVSAVSSILYLPLSIWSRPVWQQIQEEKIIKSSPIYVILSTVTKLIIVVSHTFFVQDPHIGITIHFGLTSAMVIYSFKSQPYNMGKVNLYCVVSWLFPAITGFFALLEITVFHKSQVVPGEEWKSSAVWKSSALKVGMDSHSNEMFVDDKNNEILFITMLFVWCTMIVSVIAIDYNYFRNDFIKTERGGRLIAKKIADALRHKRPSNSNPQKISPMNPTQPTNSQEKSQDQDSRIDWLPLILRSQELTYLLQTMSAMSESEFNHSIENNMQDLLFNSVGFLEEIHKECLLESERHRNKRFDERKIEECSSGTNGNKQYSFIKNEEAREAVEMKSESIRGNSRNKHNLRDSENQFANCDQCSNTECVGEHLHQLWHNLGLYRKKHYTEDSELDGVRERKIIADLQRENKIIANLQRESNLLESPSANLNPLKISNRGRPRAEENFTA